MVNDSFKESTGQREDRLTKFLNGKALNEAFENKQLRIKLRKSFPFYWRKGLPFSFYLSPFTFFNKC
jgi:hypothetical protein